MLLVLAGIPIKVPLPVALAIIAIGVVVWILVGMGALGRMLERRFSPGTIQRVARLLGLACLAGGIFLASSYYLETDQRDPVHRGLARFDLAEVALSAMLVAFGALLWAWARQPRLAGLVAAACGAAITAKPVFRPLVSDWGGQVHPYGLTSETHLYFVLSGIGLAVLGLILLALPRRAT